VSIPLDNLLVPTGYRLPPGFQNSISLGAANVNHFASSIGRGTKPRQPIFLFGPDGKSVYVIAGMGYAEASEIQDIAEAKLSQLKDKAAQGKRGFDFEAARERAGAPSAATFDQRFRESREARIKWQKAHWRTESIERKRPKRIF